MIDISQVDYQKLIEPHPMFKIFKPDEKDPIIFYKKINRLKKLMVEKYLWLSDEYRTSQAADAIISSYFSGISFNVFYEVGDFQALIGFMRILPEFKCEMTLKLIDENIWGADFARATKELIELYMEQFQLKRISTETSDKRIVRMTELAGFVQEGERPDDLRWKNKFYPKYILGKYGEKQ